MQGLYEFYLDLVNILLLFVMPTLLLLLVIKTESPCFHLPRLMTDGMKLNRDYFLRFCSMDDKAELCLVDDQGEIIDVVKSVMEKGFCLYIIGNDKCYCFNRLFKTVKEGE